MKYHLSFFTAGYSGIVKDGYGHVLTFPRWRWLNSIVQQLIERRWRRKEN